MALEHQATTKKIIKAFYAVYNTLGYGFAEKVYQNAMLVELRRQQTGGVKEHPINVYYRNELVGEFRADLLVENAVVVELKARKELEDGHEAQLLNYLRSSTYEVGLLMNFGPKPEVMRRLYTNDRKGSMSWIQK